MTVPLSSSAGVFATERRSLSLDAACRALDLVITLVSLLVLGPLILLIALI